MDGRLKAGSGSEDRALSSQEEGSRGMQSASITWALSFRGGEGRNASAQNTALCLQWWKERWAHRQDTKGSTGPDLGSGPMKVPKLELGFVEDESWRMTGADTMNSILSLTTL